jgi:lysozyme
LLAGDVAGAADEFKRWVHAGKTVLPGLIKRRAAERELFLTPEAT